MEGLLNHMIPLIQRINNHVDIHDNVSSLMRPEEQQFLSIVKQCCKRRTPLKSWKMRMSWYI